MRVCDIKETYILTWFFSSCLLLLLSVGWPRWPKDLGQSLLPFISVSTSLHQALACRVQSGFANAMCFAARAKQPSSFPPHVVAFMPCQPFSGTQAVPARLFCQGNQLLFGRVFFGFGNCRRGTPNNWCAKQKSGPPCQACHLSPNCWSTPRLVCRLSSLPPLSTTAPLAWHFSVSTATRPSYFS